MTDEATDIGHTVVTYTGDNLAALIGASTSDVVRAVLSEDGTRAALYRDIGGAEVRVGVVDVPAGFTP
jgi:hypothetical protein